MNDKISFTECRLIDKNNTLPQLAIFQNKQDDRFQFDEIYYTVNCEIIYEKFFYIYARYGKTKPHSSEVINTKTKEISENKRGKDEAELQNQFFCIYAANRETLFISNFKKNKFLTAYLKDRFGKEFIIEPYFVGAKEFAETINSIEKIQFVSKNRTLFNQGIFKDVDDIFGLGETASFQLEAKFKSCKYDFSAIFNFLLACKKKKDEGEIDRMRFIGKDNSGFEKIYNLDSVLEKMQLLTIKDENGMYDPQNIKAILLKHLEK